MSEFVVDSSVVVKWLLPEADSSDAVRFAADVGASRGRMVILDLAQVETANAIWKQFHRHLISLPSAQQTTALIWKWPVVVERATSILSVGQDLALKYDRSVYDALFVALTQHLQLPGITADEPLWQAVKADFPQIMLLRDWPVSNPG